MARVASMDIAKGIAILCVIVGHSEGLGVSPALVSAIFTFHMPLFFILSGYFTRPETALDAAFVRKNARALLVPYALTALAVIVLQALRVLIADPAEVPATVARWTVASLYGAGAGVLPPGVTAIGAIWFLLAMFWAKLFLAAANAAPHTPWVVLGIFVLGYASTGALPYWLPFSLQAGLCATLFMYVGQRLRAADVFAAGRLHPLLWAAIAAFWALCMYQGVRLCMVENIYPNGPVVDILGGVCGTLCVVKLSQLVERGVPLVAGWLERLGAITLPLFCAHLIELDAFPWPTATGLLSGLPVPLVVSGLVLRLAAIAAIAGVLYVLPRRVSGVFYPARRLAVQAGTDAPAKGRA